MKINRRLGILMHVLTHGQSTAQALAARFEVSTRTIRRDMEDLSQAGIPIFQDVGAEQVLDKLGAIFGLSRQEEWLRVDFSAWGLAPKDLRFGSLRDAIRNRRLVRFTYRGQDGVLDVRIVEPMTLLYRGTSWYLGRDRTLF